MNPSRESLALPPPLPGVRLLRLLVSGLLALGGVASAQPSISGAANAASYLSSALPNGGIAQGSVFTIFGASLGPAKVATPSRLPLDATLAGVSVQVQAGSASVNAVPIVAFDKQISAILPSDTPLGTARPLTYNGQTSAPFPIEVVGHALGIFAITQAGSGPGIFTDPDYSVNTLFNSASPSSTWIIWGTGLGAVAGNEASQPLPGNMSGLNVKVYVAGVQAAVTYSGRSGCCAGLDQIAFIVPANVSGCYAPLTVVVNGVPSNSVTMSIARSGKVCSDPGGLSTKDLQQAETTGTLAVGSINFIRTTTVLPEIPGLPGAGSEFTADSGSALFERYKTTEFIGAQSFSNIFPEGGCFVYAFQPGIADEPEAGDPPDPVPSQLLDAGPFLEVKGPLGAKQIPKLSPGLYGAELGGGLVPTSPPFLTAGNYTVSNGFGGADIQPFSAQLKVAGNLVWTNRSSINSIPGGQPLGIAWEGPTTGLVYIVGFSVGAIDSTGTSAAAAFICTAAAADRRFDVPAYVIGAMPPTASVEGISTGALSVGLYKDPVKFSAPGLDTGFITHGSVTLKTVSFAGP